MQKHHPQDTPLVIRAMPAAMRILPPAALLAFCATLFFVPPFHPEAAAQDKPSKKIKAATKPKSDARKWSFALLPTAFQRNPLLDFTIVTEMTDEGRKLPPPAFEKPVYYMMTSAGHHVEGQDYGNIPPMKIEQLKDKLIEALASNGYRASDQEHPPMQILRLVWGEHNTIETFDGVTSISLGNDYSINQDNYRNILSRAKIVGGNNFAKEMETAISEQAESAIGGNLGPFRRFTERDDLTTTLVSQVFDSCYYLIVQSFDAATYARTGERVLLWQTNMTTPAQGVSLDQTMPGLIDNGAYFFGRETKTPEIVTKRPVKEGRVQIGETEVKEYIMPSSGTNSPPTPPKNPHGR